MGRRVPKADLAQPFLIHAKIAAADGGVSQTEEQM